MILLIHLHKKHQIKIIILSMNQFLKKVQLNCQLKTKIIQILLKENLHINNNSKIKHKQ